MSLGVKVWGGGVHTRLDMGKRQRGLAKKKTINFWPNVAA